ncbi:Uncharacterised protein [Metamycoplasma alkalescens]|uniref:Uncharacterized protein n=1 Tax=Metamycoplasma alkalescens TaxID=45363 RepID=A0A3B0P496_9BACT|nr:Uncharacterised protein [Metamycoplasma alkalescens]
MNLFITLLLFEKAENFEALRMLKSTSRTAKSANEPKSLYFFFNSDDK